MLVKCIGRTCSFDCWMRWEDNTVSNMNDFHAFKSTGGCSDGSSGGGGRGFGCGGIVVVFVILLLLFFVVSGASWDAIDTLLGLGFLAFLFARKLF